MSMKKWTDDELITTRDNLEAWKVRSNNSGAGSRLWLLTAFLGAFAISTGFAFIFLDGIDVLSIILIIMGTVTCVSWYKSEKQRKDNIAFLAAISKEIDSRKIKDKTKSEKKINQPESVVEVKDPATSISDTEINRIDSGKEN